MPPPTSTDQLQSSIIAFLSSKNLSPTQEWLQQFMPSIRASLPIASLQQTALFRILSTDLTSSVQATSASALLLANMADPSVREKQIQGPVTVQVLDVEDVGHSRWSQVEALEMEERGEMTKGREVIRVVPDAEEGSEQSHLMPGNSTGSSASGGPHKLLLQDAAGTKVYGFEMESVPGVNVGMAIGTKLVLSDVTVARGVLMLRPKGTEVLGGKVEAWDRKWRDERKEVLKEKAGWKDGNDGAG